MRIRIIGHLFKFLSAAIALVIALLLLLYIGLWPHVLYLKNHNPKRTAFMRTRGEPVVQSWVPLHQISPSLRRAVIASEDMNFFDHNGFDFVELRESLKKNLRKGRFSRGGSTITMQLAKNLYLSSRKSPIRKILEAVITLRLEHTLSKTRILELYLNLIEWGDHVYGAEAAARHHFGKSASALTPAESAYLSVIIPNPRLLPRYPRYVERRKNWILRRIGESPPAQEPPKPAPVEEIPPEIIEDLPPEPPPGDEPAPLPPETDDIHPSN